MTTLADVLSHMGAAAGAAGPVIGLLIGERAKRKTAEAQTTEHVAKAIANAVAAATSSMQTNLDQTADIARAAMKKADACEQGRGAEKKSCEERILKNEGTIATMRVELSSMHELIKTIAPSTIHRGVVE